MPHIPSHDSNQNNSRQATIRRVQMKVSVFVIAAAVFGGMYFVKNHVDTSAFNKDHLLKPTVQSAQR